MSPKEYGLQATNGTYAAVATGAGNLTIHLCCARTPASSVKRPVRLFVMFRGNPLLQEHHHRMTSDTCRPALALVPAVVDY